MKNWTRPASTESLQKTVDSLKKENFEVLVVENGQKAREKVLELIPIGAEVMTMASQTLEAIGVTKEINESGKYASIKTELMKMDRATQGLAMQKLGAAPEWTIGSVHAVSTDGHIFIASNTGSQLGPYAFSCPHVIWVVGYQKIVKNWDEGVKRVYEYALLKESERQKSLGNVNGSYVSKLLVINKEIRPGRVTVILVKENLGF